MRFTRLAFSALFFTICTYTICAQEGPTPTQTLVRLDSKAEVIPTANDIRLELNGKPTPVTSLTPLRPAGVQIALLIDDGLRRSVGSQLGDIESFFRTLPAGSEILVGYMENGTVRSSQGFTQDHAAAASSLRMPFGEPGMSASPYFCLSDFVKKWPGGATGKARIVLMLTNGVDPYNGSTRLSNQDSPYVQTAVDDANRAGVAVYSIYYGDSAMRGGSFSGQSYLRQVGDSTGGEAYYEGTGSPVSLQPFLRQFSKALSETFIATFMAVPTRKDHDTLQVKMNTDIPKLKLHHADAIRPGNVETSVQP